VPVDGFLRGFVEMISGAKSVPEGASGRNLKSRLIL